MRDLGILLLDEPAIMLDFARQGRIVVAVLHDLGLVAQWADRIVMMRHRRLACSGAPADVLTARTLAQVYGIATRVKTCLAGPTMVMVDGVDAPANGLRPSEDNGDPA